MATNAYGMDFYEGQIFHSRDKREAWRHVRIFDLLSGRALCQSYVPQTGTLYSSRKTKISLKALASSAWELCNDARPCAACKPPDPPESKIEMAIEISSSSDDEQIDKHATLIADIIQAQTRCSNAAASDLKNALAEFAEEIKRQAIEP